MRPARVALEDGAEGLAAILHGLLSAAIEDPRKAELLGELRGTVAIHVPDAGVDVGLRFAGGGVTVSDRAPECSDVKLTVPSDTLLGLPTVPLLLGLPSVLSPGGRDFVRQMLTRRVRIRGLAHVRLLAGVTTLLSVA